MLQQHFHKHLCQEENDAMWTPVWKLRQQDQEYQQTRTRAKFMASEDYDANNDEKNNNDSKEVEKPTPSWQSSNSSCLDATFMVPCPSSHPSLAGRQLHCSWDNWDWQLVCRTCQQTLTRRQYHSHPCHRRPIQVLPMPPTHLSSSTIEQHSKPQLDHIHSVPATKLWHLAQKQESGFEIDDASAFRGQDSVRFHHLPPKLRAGVSMR